MSAPLRLVLDTNVVISALLWNGRPGDLLDLGATDQVRLYTSEVLLDELELSLAKPRLAARLQATDLSPQGHVANYASMTALVEPAPLPTPASRDSDDDRVLACAVAASANAVVTGDDDLLVLGAYKGIAILRVGECLEVIAGLAAHDAR